MRPRVNGGARTGRVASIRANQGGPCDTRLLSVLFVFALLASACGSESDPTNGSDNDPTTTSPGASSTSAPSSTAATTAPTTAPTAATSAPVLDASGDFCTAADTSETLVEGVDFLSADLAAAMDQWPAAIDAAEAAAPQEIAGDVGVIAAAARELGQVLR